MGRASSIRSLLSGLACVLLLAGCGLEADTQIRTRADVGVPEERALQVADVEFVCPHVVPINEREFNAKDVGERGEVDGVFGPFVPCGTVVPAGTGECPSCHGKYRTPGERADGDDPPPLASWKFSCPYCHEAIDPVYVSTRGSDPHAPNRFASNQCPKCKRYYEAQPSDVLTAIAIHEEVVCPSCLKPIDPTLNACTNSSCRLGGVVRNVEEIEGPCWRCGGQGLCPECHGSGSGTLAIYGATPADCWACGTSGRCVECDGTGFTTYTGGLPPKFSSWKVQQGQATALESNQRGWQHPAEEAPAPGGEGEGAGGEGGGGEGGGGG